MKQGKILFIKTDGGARGNPGPAAVGVYIYHAGTRKPVARFGKYIGEATNNVAEYTAVVEALGWVKKNLSVLTNKYTLIQVICDSKLVVNQLSGLYKIKNSRLAKLVLEIKTLELAIGIPVSYRYVRREENQEPDTILNNILINKTM